MLTSPYDALYGPDSCTSWNKCIPLEFLKKAFDPRMNTSSQKVLGHRKKAENVCKQKEFE